MNLRPRHLPRSLPDLLDRFGLQREQLPRVTTSTRPTHGGWAFTAGQVLTTTALLTAAAPPGWRTHGLFLTGLAALVTLAVLRPAAGSAGLLLTIAGGLLWISGDSPLDPRVFWLAPIGYLLWRTTWWAARVSPSARVEVAATFAGWRRDAMVLAATELLALAAWGVTRLPGLGAAVLVGALALAALTVLALPREGDG